MTTTPMTGNRFARGYMVLSTINCLEANYDDAQKKRVYDQVSPDVRSMIGHHDKVHWYPVHHVSDLFRGIALLDDDEERAHDRLVQVGRYIGSNATNTFLKLILRIMTPRLFARKVGDFWARDHKIGTLKADASRVDERIIHVTLSGVGGYDYVGPTGTGFMMNALETIGMKGVEGKIMGWSMAKPGPDEMNYVLTWKPG